MKKLFLFFVLSLVLLYVSAYAPAGDFPKIINYQGMLTESNGTTPVQGFKSITFKIWSHETSTSSEYLKWGDTYTKEVVNGLFNVRLGDPAEGGVAGPINLFFNEQYWLEIKVGGDPPLTPRIKLTSVGYAYRALVADSVATGGVASSSSAGFQVPYDSLWYFLRSQQISCPENGYVLAIGTAHAYFPRTKAGEAAMLYFGLSKDAEAVPENVVTSAGACTYGTGDESWFHIPVTCHALFPVSAGQHIFYFIVMHPTPYFPAVTHAHNVEFTLLYIKNAYGTGLLGGEDVSGKEVLEVAPAFDNTSVSGVKTSPSEASRFEQELEGLKAEMEALKAKLEKQESQSK